MPTPKITKEEQEKLRNEAKVKLEYLEKYLLSKDTVLLVDNFKNKFNICETIYKLILAEHQKRKGIQDTSFLKVNMRQVPHAMNFAGYTFDKSLLNELFGAASTKGRTVKKLRDAVTHDINDDAVNEIISRQDELFEYMQNFIEVIKTFDEVAA